VWSIYRAGFTIAFAIHSVDPALGLFMLGELMFLYTYRNAGALAYGNNRRKKLNFRSGFDTIHSDAIDFGSCVRAPRA